MAKSVSNLQKIRLRSGELGGIIELPDGTLMRGRYDELLQEVIHTDSADLLRDFILTIGVVSNHGNWFTAQNQNKEMKVLANAYDWLLFLTDTGLAEFIQDLLLTPTQEYQPIREAFLASYQGVKGQNQFTKVQINWNAHLLLRDYFVKHLDKIESWFNIVAPTQGTITALRENLSTLSRKRWGEIF